MQWQPINNATVLVASTEILVASWHSHHASCIILGGRRAQINGGHSQTSVMIASTPSVHQLKHSCNESSLTWCCINAAAGISINTSRSQHLGQLNYA